MKILIPFLFIISLFVISCESSNIDEKYTNTDGETPSIPTGEIAYFPLDGNLTNTVGDRILLNLSGTEAYTSGLNTEYGQGLKLDGESYLSIPIGYHDTLALVFWVKGEDKLAASTKPVLVDYGSYSISATLELDAVSAATVLSVQNNGSNASSKETGLDALNSFSKYSFFYYEVSEGLTRVYYKSYFPNGKEKVYKEDYQFPGVIDPKSEILYIGRSSVKSLIPNSMLNGSIDEVHIFNKKLTENEINAFANIVPE